MIAVCTGGFAKICCHGHLQSRHRDEEEQGCDGAVSANRVIPNDSRKDAKVSPGLGRTAGQSTAL